MNTAVALVTGASTGIGRAIAVALASRKMKVFLVARSKDKLEKTKELVEAAGGIGEILVADLSNLESIQAISKTVTQQTASVDILVHAAALWHGNDEVYAGKAFETFPRQVVIDTFMVGLVAPALVTHELMPHFTPDSVVISVTGTFENGGRGWVPYYASKRGLEDFTVALSQEFETTGARAMCISPSDTASEEYAYYFPEDAAEANSVETVAQEVLNLVDSGKNGDCIVVKLNERMEGGFHK